MVLALKDAIENDNLSYIYFLGCASGLFCLYLFWEGIDGIADDEIFNIFKGNVTNEYLKDLIEIHKTGMERVCH